MCALFLMIAIGCVKKEMQKAVSSAEKSSLVEQDKALENSDEEINDVNEEKAKEHQDNPSKKHINLPSGVVIGTLSKSLIDAEVNKHISDISSCHTQELQSNSSLSGRIVIKFVIARDGSVSKAESKEDTVGSEKVNQCILEQFLNMRFPEPKGGGVVIASHPFVFSADKE